MYPRVLITPPGGGRSHQASEGYRTARWKLPTRDEMNIRWLTETDPLANLPSRLRNYTTISGGWWRGLDSNQCTLSEQIYSLPDLTTLPPLHSEPEKQTAPVPGRVVGAVYVGAVNACQHRMLRLSAGRATTPAALLLCIKTGRASP